MIENLQVKFYEGENVSPDLFSTDAEEWAKKIYNEGGGKKNKTSQIRKFYDEILNFYISIKSGEEYKSLLPYIKMLNAKVTYAEGRNLVTASFTSLIKQCISQLKPDKPETIEIMKSFFEAFMGYYKFYESKS